MQHNLPLLPNLLWLLPNLIAIVGLTVCLIESLHRRSLGLLIIALYFSYNLTYSVINHLRENARNAEILSHAVVHQAGAITSPASVLVTSLFMAAPLSQVLLVIAAIMLSRQLAVRRPA